MSVFYILPNQLFECICDDFVKQENITKIVLWEHPDFFTKYNFNKKKLVLHRASMKYFYDNNLKKKIKSIKDIEYIEFTDKHKFPDRYVIFDPINKMNDIHELNKGDIIIKESPNFLLTKEHYNEISNDSEKIKTRFTSDFYAYCKTHLNYLKKIPSQDKFNRKKLNDKKVKIPTIDCDVKTKEKKYLIEAVQYVDKHFSNNYGTLENVTNTFMFPISSKVAKTRFNDFVKERMHLYGKYQDAIVKDNSVLFHSMLSCSLNIGILQPSYILKSLRRINTQDVSIQNTEAFFRQLCWREYQRYCYIHHPYLSKMNHLRLYKKLDKRWYDGTLNIDPVDNCIKKAFNNAYLHHIERLMVIGNYMLLNKIKPSEGFKWFMEFAIDSYEWVMHQNVYDMVFFCSGGKTSYKPYFTSNNYILKMSNYSRKDGWNDKWKAKYIAFIKNKKDILIKLPRSFPNKYLK